MRIKVITSKPNEDQEGIENLIGQEFDVVIDDEDGTVQVNAPEFWGPIVINKNEYEVIEPLPIETESEKVIAEIKRRAAEFALDNRLPIATIEAAMMVGASIALEVVDKKPTEL